MARNGQPAALQTTSALPRKWTSHVRFRCQRFANETGELNAQQKRTSIARQFRPDLQVFSESERLADNGLVGGFQLSGHANTKWQANSTHEQTVLSLLVCSVRRSQRFANQKRLNFREQTSLIVIRFISIFRVFSNPGSLITVVL